MKIKEITIYQESGADFIIENKVIARKVLTDIHPEFNFYLHESVGDHKFKFTVTEESSGRAVCHDKTALKCIKQARAILSQNSYDSLRVVVDAAISHIKRARKGFLNNPLWNAMQAADFTATELQLNDILLSLRESGYQIIKVS